ncbi:MAG: fimbrillin family protein [Rikenellaceae bacterium]
MKRLLLIPTLLLLLCGCTKSDLTENIEVGDIEESTPITINVDSECLTRGTVVEDEATMATVGMYCAYTAQADWSSTSVEFNKMQNAQFDYNSETMAWDYSTENTENQPEWGHTSITDKYTFYAYSPHSSTNSNVVPSIVDGALQIAYTVPESFDEQQDILVATPRKNIYPQTGGKVNMEFNHALAKVSFSVKGDPGRKISIITLKDLQSTGTLTFDNDNAVQWSNGQTTQSFSVSTDGGLKGDVTSDAATSQNITTDDGYLFMIPQDPSGKMVDVTVVDADGINSETFPLTIPDDQEWVAGGSYNYTINVEDDDNWIYMIEEDDVTKWKEENKDKESYLVTDYFDFKYSTEVYEVSGSNWMSTSAVIAEAAQESGYATKDVPDYGITVGTDVSKDVLPQLLALCGANIRLPIREELMYIWIFIGNNKFVNAHYWSSTVDVNSFTGRWYIRILNGHVVGLEAWSYNVMFARPVKEIYLPQSN